MRSTFPHWAHENQGRSLCAQLGEGRLELSSLAQGTLGGERSSRSQKVNAGGGRNTDPGTQSLNTSSIFFFLLFAFPFCLFYGPQASLKGSLGLKLQHIINNGGKGGMLTRAKFRVCCLACDKPENNCEMPALPYSSNVNELLSNKRPPKALIPLSLSPGRRQNWTESMLDWLLPEFIQLWKILVYNNPGWGML